MLVGPTLCAKVYLGARQASDYPAGRWCCPASSQGLCAQGDKGGRPGWQVPRPVVLKGHDLTPHQPKANWESDGVV